MPPSAATSDAAAAAAAAAPPALEPIQIRNIPLSYNVDDSDASARKLLFALNPEWQSSPGELEFVRFKDGITNTLFKAIKKRPGCSDGQVDSEAVLLRAYGNGTAVLIDREREAQSHSLLARYHLAPALLARFNNGLLYRFIAGDACSPADLRRPDVWPATARHLARWHAVLPVAEAIATPGFKDKDRSTDDLSAANGHPHAPAQHPNGNGSAAAAPATNTTAHMMALLPPGTPAPNLWTVLQRWMRALPARTPGERERNAGLQAALEHSAAALGATRGLCAGGAYVLAHCDLLSGNVIVHPGGPAPPAPQAVSFIDYEYATPAPAAFDLANHLAEWAGFECAYGDLPTRAQRRAFLAEYAAGFRAHETGAGAGGEGGGGDDDVAALMAEVDAFRGMPGLFWGVWALIQAEISAIDFDYETYAARRLGEYWAWREGRAEGERERRWAQEG